MRCDLDVLRKVFGEHRATAAFTAETLRDVVPLDRLPRRPRNCRVNAVVYLHDALVAVNALEGDGLAVGETPHDRLLVNVRTECLRDEARPDGQFDGLVASPPAGRLDIGLEKIGDTAHQDSLSL